MVGTCAPPAVRVWGFNTWKILINYTVPEVRSIVLALCTRELQDCRSRLCLFDVRTEVVT